MKPHKHAELIKAWADGAEIQYRPVPDYGDWKDPIQGGLMWLDDVEYRIKPESKPDVVITGVVKAQTDNKLFSSWYGDIESNSNIKLIFDGETGELKSAEVLK